MAQFHAPFAVSKPHVRVRWERLVCWARVATVSALAVGLLAVSPAQAQVLAPAPPVPAPTQVVPADAATTGVPSPSPAPATEAPAAPSQPAPSELAPSEPAPTATSSVPSTICEGRAITAIDVQGFGRVSAEDIRATLKLKPGMPCTDGEVTRDANALWDLGYFRDVRVDATEKGNGIALVFIVEERPAIGEIVFEGNDELSESDLKEKITLEQGGIFSEPDLRAQVGKIRELYAEKGFFLAKIRYELLPRPNNEVTVRFVIDESDKVTVRRIRFVGNENLADSELQGVMQTSQTGLLSFLSSNDTYRKEVFDEDLNRLHALYYDHGYLTVELDDARIELTADMRNIDLTIPIKEGPRFRVGRVRAQELDDQGAEIEPLAGRRTLRESIELNPGEWFSRSTIVKNIQDITRYYRDRGYARAEVLPQTDLDLEKRIVHVGVSIRRGPLVYIQRINIKGNDKTRDEVLRREAKIVEGQLYSQTEVERSKERMTALGYFESVNISEQDGSTPERIVINFEVVEKPTGTFQLGAGFSSQETFLLTGQVQQQNLFGRGQSLSFNLQLSGIRQMAQIRFVEPYLFGTEWTSSVELFKMLRQLSSFDRDSTGGSLSFGHPIFYDDLRLFLTYRLEYVDITPATGGVFGTGTGLDYQIYQFLPIRNLFRSGLTSSVRLSVNWDSRDNRLFPTKGVLATASTEVSDAALLSENDFIRNEVNVRFYQPLIGPLVGKLNTQWGLITSHDSLGVPVYERYFLGGITDVRGFRLQSLGPKLGIPTSFNDPTFQTVPERGLSFGGNMELYYNLEVEFPIIDAVGIKGVVFQDAGNTWNLEKSLEGPKPAVDDSTIDPSSRGDLADLRFSWGFGVRWFSPLGPLRFEWGFPFDPRTGYEDDVEFQFTVGNAF